MINWLRNLFSKEVELSLRTGDPVAVPKIRKTRKILDATARNSLVIDRNINKMKFKDIAIKYNISTSYAFNIHKKRMLNMGIVQD